MLNPHAHPFAVPMLFFHTDELSLIASGMSRLPSSAKKKLKIDKNSRAISMLYCRMCC